MPREEQAVKIRSTTARPGVRIEIAGGLVGKQQAVAG